MAHNTTQPEIIQEVRNLLKQYGKTLRQEGINVEKMLLFGSYAQGKQRPWSDIDVAVISSDFGQDYSDERVKLMHLASKTSNLIEPHPLHPDDLNDRWSTLASEIKKYGIAIE